MTLHETYKISESASKYSFARPVPADDLVKIEQLFAQPLLRGNEHFKSPVLVGDYFTAAMKNFEREASVCLFIDNQQCKNVFETLSNGTIDGASAYLTEMLARAPQLNAAAVSISQTFPSHCFFKRLLYIEPRYLYDKR